VEGVFLLSLVALSSSGALVYAARRGRPLAPSAIRAAAARALECVGLTAVFFAANLGLGAVVSFLIRAATPLFVSLYLSTDVSLLVLSALQALVFQHWLAGSRGRASTAVRRPGGD
jgi:hypothetical protein